MLMICPYCHTPGRHWIAPCRTNARILLHNCAILLAFLYRPWVNVVRRQPDESPRLISFLRVCRACRRRFLPRAASVYVAMCWQCGYCLIGNESGVCPECGRRLCSFQRRLMRAGAGNPV